MAGTGPYYKIFANTGYVKVTADVTIPGGGSYFSPGNTGYGQTEGYIYFGGSGTSGADPIDAGIGWLPNVKPNYYWIPFMADRVSGVYQQISMKDVFPQGLQPGTTAHMEFQTLGPSVPCDVQLYVSGTDKQSGLQKSGTLVTGTYGWNYDGSNAHLKQVTSIGQTGDGASQAWMSGAVWNHVNLYPSGGGAYELWQTGQTYGTSENYKPPQVVPSIVDAYDHYEVSINLSTW